MTFTHHDIQDRIIGYLYGELGADERAAFDEHVASCADCGAEVAALEATRSLSRQAVRASLDEPIPAGLRGRVLEAATRAAQSRQTATEAVSAAPGAPPPRFAWLRARWTLPMFATVAAMGALLLTRETIFREARHPLGDTPVAAPAPENEPESPTLRPTAEPAEPVAPVAPFARPTTAKSEQARSRSEDGQEKAADRPRAAAGAAPSARQAYTVAKKKAVAPPTDLKNMTEPARPAARAPAPPPARADQASARRRTSRDISDDLLDAVDVPAPAAAVAPPAAVQVPASAGASARDSARARAAARPAELAKESREGAGADPALELGGRADRAMRTGNWPEAIALYGDLLRRFPGHPFATLWRRQLATAQAAASRPADSRVGDPRFADPRFAAPPPAR